MKARKIAGETALNLLGGLAFSMAILAITVAGMYILAKPAGP